MRAQPTQGDQQAFKRCLGERLGAPCCQDPIKNVEKFGFINKARKSHLKGFKQRSNHTAFTDIIIIRKVEVFVAQSCPALCSPLDCGPRDSPGHGILQEGYGVGCRSFLQGILPTVATNHSTNGGAVLVTVHISFHKFSLTPHCPQTLEFNFCC